MSSFSSNQPNLTFLDPDDVPDGQEESDVETDFASCNKSDDSRAQSASASVSGKEKVTLAHLFSPFYFIILDLTSLLLST